jgi:hypothetical protein
MQNMLSTRTAVQQTLQYHESLVIVQTGHQHKKLPFGIAFMGAAKRQTQFYELWLQLAVHH